MPDAADDVHASAAAGGANRRPPPLSMSFVIEGGHARRQSTMSSGSSDSDDVEVYSALSALDSSAALILVHDQDEPASPLDYTEDEDDLMDDEELVSPMFEVRRSVAFQSLSPSLVFLFLLAPFLKLGALNLSNTRLPLKYGLPSLLISALASVFARQIWYMLARYVRKADMTDILLDTFAKGRGKERQRSLIRGVIRACNALINLLLAVTYLRFSIYTVLPLLLEKLNPALAYILSVLLTGSLVAYLSFARSLSSRRVAYTSWLSVATYVAWLACTIYAHKDGVLEVEQGLLGNESVWQGIATIAFAFCSSSTLPLYASLKSHPHLISTSKSPRSRSFRLLSFASVFIAVLLLLPSVIFSAFPNRPAMSSLSFAQQTTPPPIENSTSAISTSMTSLPFPASTAAAALTHIPTHIPPVLHPLPALAPPLTSDITLPKVQIQTARRLLSAATLLLGIPPIILTIPPPALPQLRSPSLQFNVNRACTIFVVLLLSLIPPRTFPSSGTGAPGDGRGNFYLVSSGLFAILTLLMLFMTLLGTYTVPAVVHILIHFFKRPIAIVVPARTPLLHTPSTSADFGAGAAGSGSRDDDDDNDNDNDGDGAPPRHSSPRAVYGAAGSGSRDDDDDNDNDNDGDGAPPRHSSPRAVYDELLLRKERALQKKQFRKRIVWDIGVWLLLAGSLLVVVGFARTISFSLS